MYIDLNVPIPSVIGPQTQQSKKGKGKQPQQAPAVTYTPAQISSIEARIDLLSHLGYTIIAFNQTVQKKVDPKSFANTLNPLLSQLRKRDGILYLKRLTIVLDEESEKGFGLINANASLFASYDLLALMPTTAGSFSLACLSHTLPSNLTTHIISLPLTLPRLPFNLKHTLVRSALKNGAVFELSYVGALGGEGDGGISALGGVEGGSAAKRNWWAAAREVVRVTKGKGIIVSSGAANQSDLRAPRDVGNLITFLGLATNLCNDASTKTPQSLILRAQTRKTYRAVFSEPKIVIPESTSSEPQQEITTTPAPATQSECSQSVPPSNTKKRPIEEVSQSPTKEQKSTEATDGERKRKKNKNKQAK
ncbi:RNase P protein component 3 family protein [Abortiporus biennis]